MYTEILMKRFYSLVLSAAFIIAFGTSGAFAAEPTLKIGVFDLQKIIMQSKTTAEYRQKFSKEIEAKRKVFSDKQRAVGEIEEKLKKSGQAMDPVERKALEGKLGNEGKEMRRMKEDLEADLKNMEKELTRKSVMDIAEVVKKIYESENYTIIFEKSGAGIAQFRSSVDITDKVLKMYDNR